MEANSFPSHKHQVSEVFMERREQEQPPSLDHNKYIATLPNRNDWKFKDPLYQYQGFWYSPHYLRALMVAQDKFMAQPTDIILCSHPKTGTTWLKALAYTIVTRSHFSSSNSPLLTEVPHDCVPFFEMGAAQNVSNRNPEIPLVATHIPYTLLPKSIGVSGCKIVYICRDPKDVFVSLYHFERKLKSNEGVDFRSMEDAFELFCEGVSRGGPYLEHVLGYWKAYLDQKDRVLFLKYEDMKNQTVHCVKKLAEFIGYPFTVEEEEQGVVQKVIDVCSFESLSNLQVTKSGEFLPNSNFTVHNGSFYRKGEIGDWKNHLSLEMGARLDEITEQKLLGSGLTLLSAEENY